MKNQLYSSYLFLLLFSTGMAFADDNNVDELPPPINVECIPTVALPVYPEAATCAAYITPESETIVTSDSTDDSTSNTNSNQGTTTSTTTVNNYSSPTTYYYPISPYYYPQNYNNTSGVFLGLVTGLAIGGLFYAINHNNDVYYNNYYNNYFNNYYYNNNGYKNSWHGENGNAGFYHGPNGGAYYWSANGHEGGGYCYQGTCNHNNDLYKDPVQKTDTVTHPADDTQLTHSSLTSKPNNVSRPNNISKMPAEHFNINRPDNFHYNARGFEGHGFGGMRGGRR